MSSRNKWVDFCPRCGSHVEEALSSAPVDRDYQWGDDIEPSDEYDGSVKVRCTNPNCMFSDWDTCWTLHHPAGSQTSPGESFSLSWIR